ncbi:flexible cuticle protein 12-like [Agrilus planipennis]|uniref:Flexible cuticle protein 12-like n=1 Tax=Agrilus planipennis TaxID=224129 RepID=A0A1W4WJ47_AGRPL|nr:flexible cuticle protein 12-like [Agrilus planipennis]
MIFIFAFLFLCANAAPQSQADRDAVITKYDSNNIGLDGYNFAYETSNRISQQEDGQLQNVGTDNESIAVRGQFSFVAPDGVTYTVNYIADENGFQPQGAHLPA